ncbi:hypothetical protein PENTCL1PPCAC_16678, partial [Pristionchus entomophagus]
EVLLPLASAAYADDPTQCLNRQLPGSTLNRRFEIPYNSTGNNTCSAFTFVDESRQMIGLVFRGTNSDEQLAYETQAILSSGQMIFQDGGKVAPYFNNAYFTLWNSAGLGCNVQEMCNKYPNFHLFITGHSLGGAMAALSAVHIISSGVHSSRRMSLYTFGEPRTGDEEFARLLDFSVAYRVVHNNDKIPHIPTQSMGYEHHGTEIFYENDMQPGSPYQTCRGDEDANCSDK